MTTTGFKSSKLDLLGSALSIGCALHCLIFPILISLGSVLAIGDAFHELTEVVFFSLTLIVGMWSFISSYPKHKKVGPLFLISLSLILIVVGRLSFEASLETTLNVSGAFLIASAHVFNGRLLSRHTCDS